MAARPSYPAAPVLDRIRGMDPQVASEMLGVTPRTIMRWRDGGGLFEDTADSVAQRLGDHIAHLWPDEYREFTKG